MNLLTYETWCNFRSSFVTIFIFIVIYSNVKKIGFNGERENRRERLFVKYVEIIIMKK